MNPLQGHLPNRDDPLHGNIVPVGMANSHPTSFVCNKHDGISWHVPSKLVYASNHLKTTEGVILNQPSTRWCDYHHPTSNQYYRVDLDMVFSGGRPQKHERRAVEKAPGKTPSGQRNFLKTQSHHPASMALLNNVGAEQRVKNIYTYTYTCTYTYTYT